MKVRPQRREAGFTLIEVVVATALTASLSLCVFAAIASSLHAVDRLENRVNLSDDALNILSDLRESTAYDPAALKQIVGHSLTTTFTDPQSNAPARKLQARLSVTQTSPAMPIFATVTVVDAAGNTATERQTLSSEAPAPGSVIDAATASPSAGE
jgi:prepilin-type N-terminal cleavage/methylation domain-containing protein